MDKPSPPAPDALEKPGYALKPGYLPHDVSLLMNALNARLSKVLRPVELTTQQFRVMQFLHWATVSSIGGISKGIIIEQSVVSRIVAQLEDRGFVIRSKHPRSARVVEVKLTAVGLAVFNTLNAQAQQIVRETEAVLSEPERQQLQALMARLLAQVLSVEG